jgi:hypothetical protein
MPRPHWRKMTWLLIIFSALMLIWIVAGANSANCSDQHGHYQQAKQAGCEAGTGIGIAALIILWFIGFMILSGIWFMTRPRGRDCPVCGELVKKGRTLCDNCGYDFTTGVTQRTVETGQAAVSSVPAVAAPARPQAIPAGWFPDPWRHATERYWDGNQWTGHIRGEVQEA